MYSVKREGNVIKLRYSRRGGQSSPKRKTSPKRSSPKKSSPIKIPLGNFGYSSTKSKETRQKALTKVVKKYGKKLVVERLNALKKTYPTKSKIFIEDEKFVKKL